MDTTPSNNDWCIVSPGTCSAALRRLAEESGWTLLERIDGQRAARSVVALGAARVAVEAPSSSHLPPLAELLATLDATDRVVCILRDPTAVAERRASRLGVAICDSAATFAAWYVASRTLRFPTGAPTEDGVAHALPSVSQ